MGTEFLNGLALSSLTFSVAVLLVLLLRSTLRTAFGASVAYSAWASAPLAAVVPFLPRPDVQTWSAAATTPMRFASGVVQDATAQADTTALFLVSLWAVGVALAVGYFVLQHRRFTTAIGPLQMRPHARKSLGVSAKASGPFLLGLWQPVIVLPMGFKNRYTARERALIVAHERVHLRRKDPIANVICAALQCLFWFNPLTHFAARAFRFDQELGCDDLVLRRFPYWRGSYAKAILKSLVGSGTTPLACQWQSIHPLKVRIMQLKKNRSDKNRRFVGHALVAAAVGAMSYGAWTAQAVESTARNLTSGSAGPVYEIVMAIKSGDQAVNPRVRTTAGIPATIQFGNEHNIWTIKLDLSPLEAGQVMSNMEIRYGQQLVASPTLINALEKSGGVHIGAKDSTPDFDLQMTVKEWVAPN